MCSLLEKEKKGGEKGNKDLVSMATVLAEGERQFRWPAEKGSDPAVQLVAGMRTQSGKRFPIEQLF